MPALPCPTSTQCDSTQDQREGTQPLQGQAGFLHDRHTLPSTYSHVEP